MCCDGLQRVDEVEFVMAKKTSYHTPQVKTREEHPIPRREKNGVLLMCPFCKPTHPIIPGKPTACGTTLRVTAVQKIISARTVRIEGLTCVKCGEKGKGEMVQYFNSFVHVEECAPDVQLLSSIPNYSKWAEIVFNLPEKLRDRVEKVTGMVQVVQGLTPDGEETGEVEGYFFAKPAPRQKVEA